MKKSSAGLTLLALAIGLSAFLMPAYAQDDSDQEVEEPASASGDTKEESFLEKLEEDFKETTTPTDEETDAIGTGEDADRDLY